ncbi:conserved Plasmodium protein, unknown function [Plasmodium gallinaceum]|uniref:Uncharacterized protein n=1 Tax=Plasmodium gallinaceum TaxID=5849 RepID=A0A1J1GWI1_PLAGA|nr:conserved Plasmodium protein, unknown function [Plasmodium gallinaceum]CRG95365.1 conserved Plasmodium protein, unknown function [Plasmodium gallinaceum]
MLENLCINLINELFLAKHNFLIFIILSDLHKNGKSSKKAKKKKITTNIEKKNELAYFNIFKKNCYLKFCSIKKKQIKRRRIIRIKFKKLRKTIKEMDENYNRYKYKTNDFNLEHKHNYYKFIKNITLFLHSFEKDLIFKKISYKIMKKIYYKKNKNVKCFKKKILPYKLKKKSNFIHIRNKKKYVDFLNSNLYDYVYKDIYNFLPNYNFEKDLNLNKKNLNCVFNKEKVDQILKKKKEIVRKIYIKNKTYTLSSKKLKKRYNEFYEKFCSFLIKLKVDKKDETKQLVSDYKVLKTLLYLKNSNISKNLDNNSLIKSKNYKIHEVISMINYLKKGLYIIKMDIIYIYIFFCSYINNIFSKLKSFY